MQCLLYYKRISKTLLFGYIHALQPPGSFSWEWQNLSLACCCSPRPAASFFLTQFLSFWFWVPVVIQIRKDLQHIQTCTCCCSSLTDWLSSSLVLFCRYIFVNVQSSNYYTLTCCLSIFFLFLLLTNWPSSPLLLSCKNMCEIVKNRNTILTGEAWTVSSRSLRAVCLSTSRLSLVFVALLCRNVCVSSILCRIAQCENQYLKWAECRSNRNSLGWGDISRKGWAWLDGVVLQNYLCELVPSSNNSWIQSRLPWFWSLQRSTDLSCLLMSRFSRSPVRTTRHSSEYDIVDPLGAVRQDTLASICWLCSPWISCCSCTSETTTDRESSCFWMFFRKA